MSLPVFPALRGLGWNVKRTPTFQTQRQQSLSGRESSTPNWQNPLWQWTLTYDVLENNPGNLDENGYTDFTRLAGLYLSVLGSNGTFLYQDPNDNEVYGQPLGLGDGVTTTWQLRRQFGSFTESIQAPAGTPIVRLNGVVTTAFTNGTKGRITFNSAPAAGVNITADFSFYFPVRFSDDSLEFNNFAEMLWEAQTVKLQQVRL